MKSILPNKKIVILAVFTLLILTTGFFALGYGDKYLDKDNLPKEDDSISVIDQTMDSLNNDSDNDGLKDWEEALWKTNVDNPDTDLDGTPDGEEVRLGRDPLKPGPDDKLEEKVVSSTGQSTYQATSINTSGTSVNLTELFSRNLGFQTSDGINPLSVDNQDLLSKVNSSTEKVLKDFIASFNPVVSEGLFKISKDNSKIMVEKYGNDLENTKKDIPYNSPEVEGEMLINAMKTKNFSSVDKYIDAYNAVIVKYKMITVPSDFLLLHKKATELTIATVNVYENVKKIDSDPLRVIIAIEQNDNIKKEFEKLTNDFNILFLDKTK